MWQACFADRVAALRLEALLFLRMALDCCPPAAFRSSFAELTPAVISCADDDWCDAGRVEHVCSGGGGVQAIDVPPAVACCRYKITAESLRVVGRLACAIAPINLDTVSSAPAAVSLADAVAQSLTHSRGLAERSCGVGRGRRCVRADAVPGDGAAANGARGP